MDLIERQEAIDALRKLQRGLQTIDASGEADITISGIQLALHKIEQLPSVQPEKDDSDLIQKITMGIDATNTKDVYSCGMRNGMRWCRALIDDKRPEFEDASQYVPEIKKLPSAQSEIIRCENCKHCNICCDNEGNQYHSCKINFDENGFWKEVMNDDFCSMAERRTDE